MKVFNQALTAGTAVLLFFSSCKKDVIPVEEEAVTEAVSSDATANSTIETSPAIHTAVYSSINSNVAGFWQSVPARYSQTTKKYPLIIFIHGIGELGTNLSKMNCCGLPQQLKYKKFPANFNVGGLNYSFIVVSPQFKRRPSAAEVQSVINYAKKRFRVDEARVYVTGLSMGGGSTWDYAAVYGQNIAAAVPVCGGTKPSTSLARAVASKNLPVWTISSSGDRVVPISWAKNWISWIDAANPSIASSTKVTVWSAEDHNATWGRAFNPATKIDGYNIYQWMLRYKRGNSSSGTPGTGTPAPAPAPSPSGNKAPIAVAKTNISVAELSRGINRVTLIGASSSDPDGKIVRYSWAKISGPYAQILNNGLPTRTYAAKLVAGTYVFRLTVTDNKGATASANVTVTVKPYRPSSGSQPPVSSPKPPSSGSNRFPVAVLRSNATTIYLSRGINRVTLDGSGSYDPDGKIIDVKWSIISRPAAGGGAMYPNGKFGLYAALLVKGTYIYRLNVGDNDGDHDTQDITIHVK